VQQQLPGGVILDVGYVGNLGRHIARTININQLAVGTRLNPPFSTINQNALRPYLGYGSISMRDDGDNSNYNSMQMTVSRRVASGLSLTGNYTWSRALDSSSGSPQNSYDARAEYGLSSVHRAHLLNVNYIYELPFFRHTGNAALRNTLGGWELAGVTTYQSGAPNSIAVTSDLARIGASSSRATLVANPNLSSGDRTLTRWFNTEAALPPERSVQGIFGNGGRNVLIGPGFNQWDLSAIKNFEIREHTALQFRAESFNVVNHPSFTGIDTTARFDAAGKPTGTYGAVTGAGPARVLEFGLRLTY
jgi:hypothetical protein